MLDRGTAMFLKMPASWEDMSTSVVARVHREPRSSLFESNTGSG